MKFSGLSKVIFGAFYYVNPIRIVERPHIAKYTLLLRAMGTAASSEPSYIHKGVTYDKTSGEVTSCLFCNIINRTEPGTIVFEDDDFVVFKTIAPVTSKHYLVTPRKHIKNANSLSGEEGVMMVQDLKRVGSKALGENAGEAQYCFHIPPLNSIDHLHLHAIAQPRTMSLWSYIKYNEHMPYCRSAADMVQSLRVGMLFEPPKDGADEQDGGRPSPKL